MMFSKSENSNICITMVVNGNFRFLVGRIHWYCYPINSFIEYMGIGGII